MNVARASLEELLLDYEDFLWHRKLEQWRADSTEIAGIRRAPRKFKADQSNPSDLTDPSDRTGRLRLMRDSMRRTSCRRTTASAVPPRFGFAV
mgnify:CR=1 FL=1